MSEAAFDELTRTVTRLPYARRIMLLNSIVQTLQVREPVCIDDLTSDELRAEIQKGVDDFEAGRVISSEQLRKELTEEFGL